MDMITKLENKLLNWAKSLPHLPGLAQKWLGTNVWWIVLIFAIFSAVNLIDLMTRLSIAAPALNSSNIAYIAGGYSNIALISAVIGIAFIAVNVLLLAFAVKPLKHKEKKGWVLLFMALLVQVLAVVVNAVLSLSALIFILSIMYGAVVAAISMYFLFEIHGEFAHRPKARIKKH